MAGLKERLTYFIEHTGLTVQMFEKTVGLSNGAVSKMGDNTRRSTIDKISNFFLQYGPSRNSQIVDRRSHCRNHYFQPPIMHNEKNITFVLTINCIFSQIL